MTRLQRAYAKYNRIYFGNRLPRHLSVRFERGISEMGYFRHRGPKPICIRINDCLRGWESARDITLLHEMCHLATADEKADHGPRWKRERRRLYRLSVFEPMI
jgi:hypothetical protein